MRIFLAILLILALSTGCAHVVTENEDGYLWMQRELRAQNLDKGGPLWMMDWPGKSPTVPVPD